MISENETFDFLLDVIPREEYDTQNLNFAPYQKQLIKDVERMRN